jgi:hypothetical protein
MINPIECDRNIIECRELGASTDISLRRATAAMTICRGWLLLRHDIANYWAIVKEEAR